MHNQLLFACFMAWREQAQRSSAIKVRLCQVLPQHALSHGGYHTVWYSTGAYGHSWGLCLLGLQQRLQAPQLSCLVDLQAVVLGFSTKRLRVYLLAWQQQARMLAGASRLLRRLLAVTVQGAFQEWRTVAQERAHWHRVGWTSCGVRP
jgi:hypothetical protein